MSFACVFILFISIVVLVLMVCVYMCCVRREASSRSENAPRAPGIMLACGKREMPAWYLGQGGERTANDTEAAW